MAVIRQTKHYYKEYFQIQRGAFYHYKSFNTEAGAKMAA